MQAEPADVVVVGAGLGGLAVAAHLAGRDRRVLVVDRLGPGSQASAQNAGMLRRMGEDPFERALAVRTHQLLVDDRAFAEASRRTGAVLAFGRDPRHLNDAAAHLEVVGVPHLWRDGVPAEAEVLAGAPLLGAWWLPEERVVDAWSVIQVLLDRLRDGGGALVRDEVDAIEAHGEGWLVRGQAGDRPCGQVVLAAGAWSASLARRMGLERPLFPLRRTLLHTAAHPLAHPDGPWVWVDDEGVYVRPEGGGFLLSGCDEAVDFPTSEESRGPVEAEPQALAMDKVERWFPALAGVGLRRGWTGLRTFAPDRRPLLGADPEADGLWWVAGLGGFGVSCGLAAGEAVAAWMCGDEVDTLRPRGVSPGRPMLGRWLIRPGGDLAGAEPIPGRLPATLGGGAGMEVRDDR